MIRYHKLVIGFGLLWSNARFVIFLMLLVFSANISFAQSSLMSKKSIWQPSDTINKTRFYIATGSAVGSYAIASVGLYNSWYKKNELTNFHFFNDNLEWAGMDKYGHLYSAYVESVMAFKSAKWAGVDDRKAIFIGILTGSVIQTTIEVMDGFSEKWGFSYADMGMNGLGVAAFGLQQKYWEEQRIHFKVSSLTRKYSTKKISSTDGQGLSSVDERSEELFSKTFVGRYLKDYNAQTYWASVNVASFLPLKSRFPKYINLALGYGAENMFGGFENKWEMDGHQFELDKNEYERYHQFYLGLDIDLTKIKTTNYFLKTLLSTLSLFKVPGPAIEFNTKGEVVFHLLKI